MLNRADDRLGGVPPTYYLWPPGDINMRVPDPIRKCVGFIAVREASGLKHLGTGFVVSIQGSYGNHSAFLVTAGHIAEQIESREWLLRLNTTSGVTVELVARPNSSKWYYHPRERQYVDAAATLFGPTQTEGMKADFRPIPSEMFVTEETFEEKGIGVGDEVFITGLFSKVIETTRVLPIIRMGNVAMIPGEKIPNGKKLIEAYLIESRSTGGLSGSPVFVRETVRLQQTVPKPGIKLNEVSDSIPGQSLQVIEMLGVGRYYLFGCAIGHWDLPVGSALDTERVNMGIALVTPARKILDILQQPELTEMMKKGDEYVKALRDSETKITEDSAMTPAFTQDQLNEALKKAEGET